MKTIEERAKERFPINYETDAYEFRFNQLGRQLGYIDGATDQREIDIDRAIQCFKDNWREWLLGIDRDGIVGFRIDDEQVRKYMKGE